MITIGRYRFSAMDARRTIELFPTMWAQLAIGRNADVLDRLVPVLVNDDSVDLGAVWSALLAAGPALRGAGQLPARAVGAVAGLHRSDGGVPKSAVEAVSVDFGGVVGDRQAARRHHGRPWQSLCIWSQEVIDAFAADGHPLHRGAAGENITVTGLHWPDVRPGVRLHIGGVLCEVSAFTLPCKKNAQWFQGGEFRLMHHDRGPVSRVYATVLEPGEINVGDTAVLEP